jgi:hypothetical protein
MQQAARMISLVCIPAMSIHNHLLICVETATNLGKTGRQALGPRSIAYVCLFMRAYDGGTTKLRSIAMLRQMSDTGVMATAYMTASREDLEVQAIDELRSGQV